MSDSYLIDEVRRVRHQIAQECGNDIHKITEHAAEFVRNYFATHPQLQTATTND